MVSRISVGPLVRATWRQMGTETRRSKQGEGPFLWADAVQGLVTWRTRRNNWRR